MHVLLSCLFFIHTLSTATSILLSPIGVDGLPKDWVFIIKLGKGGDNCEKLLPTEASSLSNTNIGYEDYECGMLYADANNQTLRYIPGTIHDTTGPLYKTWSQGALDKAVAYQVWNDQSGPTKIPSFGSGIAAHDKGFLLYNNESGVLGQHTCPNWLYSYSNNFRSPETFYNTSRPGGDASTYSQTFLLVSLKNRTDINAVRQMIARENARLFYLDVGTTNRNLFPTYHEPIQPISTASPSAVPIHRMFESSLFVYTKHRSEHYDYWEYFTTTFCSAQSKSQVWTYVECGAGILKSTHITDYNCYEPEANRYGQGFQFGKSNWYPNHMKVGYCLSDDDPIVAIAGWNHKKTQLVRGSLFVVLRSKELHDSFKRLFPHKNLSIDI